MKHFFLFVILTISLSSFLACSDNPVTPGDQGNLTISITGVDNASQLNKGGGNKPTITSVRVVIEKVELENSLDASVDFKFDQPFVQDLVTITSLQEIQSLQVPFGTYDQIKVDIDDLDSQDGDVFTQNPDLQNLSILVQGYRNEDPNDTFEFSSNLSFNINMDFDPPIVIDENTVSKNIVLGIDYGSWFGGHDGHFLDPGDPGNREKIERYIRKSFRVFEDDDRDGKKDDHHERETEGTIESLGVDNLVVNGKTFYVNESTIIKNDDGQKLQFDNLAVGMCVEIYAMPQEDDAFLAIKIKVEDEHDDDCNDDKEGDDKDGGDDG